MVTIRNLTTLPRVRLVSGQMTQVRVLVGGTAAPPPTGTGTYNDTELRGLIEGVKARSSHTGTQPSSSISDFLEAVQDAVATMFGGTHTGIAFSYNDTAGTLTATVSGGGGTGGLDVEAAQDTVAAMLAGTHAGISFAYNDTTGTLTATVAVSIGQVSGLQTELDNLNAASANFENRLSDAEATIAGISGGVTGPAGPTTFSWGDDEATSATTGAIYEPYLILGDSQLVGPAGAMLIGAAGSGDVTVNLESATAVAGPWTTVTGSAITILAGQRRGFTSAGAGSVIASLASQSLLRAVCTSAPSGSGGTMTWRTPASGGGAETATVTGLNIPLPTGRAAGDLMVAVLFLNSTGTPTWPTGWNAYGTPFPLGTDATLGPFYMHVATKTAGASEATVQVTFPAATAVISTLGVANGALVVPTSSNVAVIGTAATTWATPSGLTTPSASALVAHLAMPRWTAGNVPSTMTWDGSLATDTQAQTARGTPVGTGSPNVGIAVAHLTQASAGAIAVRTASGTGQARALTATLVFTGSSGSTAKGLQIQANVRAV